jgi:glycosyltransferase involved in cell wall biosynthesis
VFSVIIPLYNKSQYIEKCISSIINQTYDNFEIIIVDDGSTDDGYSRILELMEGLGQTTENSLKVLPEIHLLSQSNSGVSAARNNGVNHAKYQFIAFLDADDWWEPTYLQEMKILIEKFPDAAIYGSSYFFIKNGIKKRAEIAVEQGFSSGLINYCRVYADTLNMPLWTGATIIRRSIFEKYNGFKPTLKLGEDFDLWIRVALKYPVAFLNKPLANYNQDVELRNRAVGNLHFPENHILWNLDYLAVEERTNKDLKLLLDNLRVYSLFPYYLNKDYHLLAQMELKKVDWAKQPLSAKRRYDTPVFILKMINHIQYVGSRIKQFIICKFHPIDEVIIC